MTTKEAYLQLVQLPKIYLQLGLGAAYFKAHKNEVVKKGKYPSIDLMEERLGKSGLFGVVKEKEWKRGVVVEINAEPDSEEECAPLVDAMDFSLNEAYKKILKKSK